MIRNLKVLGLAMVALVAMSVMASSASAANFTSPAATTNLSGTQATANVLTVTGQPVTCETANFSGHVVGTSVPSVTIKPTYTGCTALNEAVSAKVTGFGHYGETSTCDYVLYASGTADLVCAAGAEVTVDAGTCTVHIPAQKNIGTITYTNNANGSVTADINITNIHANHTDGFLCPFSGGGTVTNGILSGSVVVSGFDGEGTKVNISVD